jgi:hypothetical protein
MGPRETMLGHERIVRELNEERAAALVRISRMLESLIGQLHAARVHIANSDEITRQREIARYHELHRLAIRYRWYLEVQREALGLRQHHTLDEFYAIPEPVEPRD